MQSQRVRIIPLLASSPTGITRFRPVRIDWDVRHAPHHAARVDGQVITSYHLTQLAIHPDVTTLRVISDLLLGDWVITAHNPSGVTVEDVLVAIHRGLHVPLTQPQWDCMAPANRELIEATFYARCGASRDFDRTRYGGVRRIDCLLHTTVFAGLSSLILRNNRWEAVLTLSRDFSARGRTQSHFEG